MREQFAPLALQMAQRGLGTVEPVGVDRFVQRLSLQIVRCELRADGGDVVVDGGDPGAHFAADRRQLPYDGVVHGCLRDILGKAPPPFMFCRRAGGGVALG